MRAIGLDGFARGWVAVTIDDGEPAQIAFCADVADALAGPFDRAGIDIPIGMTEDGDRLCDRLARDRLHPHRSRVFTGARRWCWEQFTDPDAANAAASARSQTRMSRQLWHLGRKVMEVDAFVRAHPGRDIREVHPELVFLRLHGRPLPAKKTAEGLSLRHNLLARAGFVAIDDWLTTARRGTGAKPDDIVDACAVALAARDPAGALPDDPAPRDAQGLAMQIWF